MNKRKLIVNVFKNIYKTETINHKEHKENFVNEMNKRVN